MLGEHSEEMSDRIHILMRFADSMMSIDDTIVEHQAIIKSRGAVWIGKIGKTLAELHIEKINMQCKQREKAYLFLVQKMESQYNIYRGDVMQMARTLPSNETAMVPKYFRNTGASFWTKLSKLSPVQKITMGDYHIASSHRPILGTLKRSMAALFVIGEGSAMHTY